MINTVILIPAYGRQYNTKYEVMKSWRNGDDFKIISGPYCSTRDMKALCNDFDRVIIHWIDKVSEGHSYTLWEHVLRGITSYV